MIDALPMDVAPSTSSYYQSQIPRFTRKPALQPVNRLSGRPIEGEVLKKTSVCQVLCLKASRTDLWVLSITPKSLVFRTEKELDRSA